MTLDIFHNLKKNLKRLSTIFIQTRENFKFMLKVSLEETSFTIPKKMKLYLDVFHNFLKIGFILKVSLQETLFTISIQTVKNFEFMLKMSLEETPSTIPKKNGIILRRLS